MLSIFSSDKNVRFFYSFLLLSFLALFFPTLARAQSAAAAPGNRFEYVVEPNSSIQEFCLNRSKRSRIFLTFENPGAHLALLKVKLELCLSERDFREIEKEMSIPSLVLDPNLHERVGVNQSISLSRIPRYPGSSELTRVDIRRLSDITIREGNLSLTGLVYSVGWTPADEIDDVRITALPLSEFQRVTGSNVTFAPWLEFSFQASSFWYTIDIKGRFVSAL